MSDKKNKIISNDPSEEKARHVCCVFLAIEMVIFDQILFCNFNEFNFYSVPDFFTELRFHMIEFPEFVKYLLIRIVLCGLSALFTILSLTKKKVYIAYEIMHMIVTIQPVQ